MNSWLELAQKYFMPTGWRLPVVMVKGQGARLWDDAGKEYLDFMGGWAVNVLGHAHPAMVKAITEQAQALIHPSPQVYNIPQLRLAQLLVEGSPFSKVFFCNSGAEANEGAIKLARKYGKLHKGGAYEVITALNSFHGRTLAMTAATGQRKYQDPYTPLPAGFVNIPFDNIRVLKEATSPNTIAVMLEPIQGEGGVNIPHPDYLPQVREWCDHQGLLLILDEVQTGIGRTGSLFAYQQAGIEPDILTLAKGLGGGFPIGAFLVKEHCAVFTLGDHGSTFGGNPLACATAYAVLKAVLEEDLPRRSREMGGYLVSCLEGLKEQRAVIREVRGRGLLVVVEFFQDFAHALVRRLLELGLLCNPVKPNALRFMPPLIIGKEEIDQATALLSQALGEFS